MNLLLGVLGKRSVKPIRSVAFVGSSSVDQGFVPSAGAGSNRYFAGNGFIVWTCAWAKQRVMAAYNATDNTYDFGFSNAQILATHIPQVITAAPDAALLYCGLNDVGTGASGATVWNGIKLMIDQLVAAGIKPIVMLIGPRASTATGGSGYWARQIASNTAIIAGCQANGVQFFDPNPFIQNLATGEPLPGMYISDGVHPNNYGASVMGKALSDWLLANCNIGPEPLTSARIASLVGVNPFMTGGTTLATGYSVFSGARNAQSKVAATDGGNNWQRLVHSPNSRTDSSQLNTNGSTIALPAGLSGNLARLWLEMRHGSKVDWQSSPGYTAYIIEAYSGVNGTGGLIAGVIRGGADAGAAYRVEIPSHAVYVSPVFRVPSDATTLSMIISNQGGGTYDYRNWGLEVVSGYHPPGIGT
jgi:lysophospholipase L1-like esterase